MKPNHSSSNQTSTLNSKKKRKHKFPITIHNELCIFVLKKSLFASGKRNYLEPVVIANCFDSTEFR